MRATILLLPLLGLAACNKPAEQPAASTATNETTTTGTVERQEITPPAEPAPPPAQPVIQTQPGPKGAQVQLNKVHVTGDVLTVQLSYVGGNGNHHMKVDQVSLIDDATAQRIGVLKDNGGKWLAAPMPYSADELSVPMSDKNGPAIVWFKFPAPPATSKTVSLNLPDVAPFDGVPVTR